MNISLITSSTSPRGILEAAGVGADPTIGAVWIYRSGLPREPRNRTGIEIQSYVGPSREYARVTLTSRTATNGGALDLFVDLDKVAKRAAEVKARAAARRQRVAVSQEAAARAREARRAEDAAAEKAAAALVNLKATASRFSGGRIIVNATLTVEEARALDALLGELRGITATATK